jgi:hypothetical protein
MATAPPTPKRPDLWAVWDFAVHLIVGTLIFSLIAGAAIALDIMIVRRIDRLGVDPFIVYGLRAAEYAVFVIDLLLFIIFLLKTAYRAAKGF